MTKSSAYSPLDGLVDLACRDGVEIRPTLLRVLTDLYVRKHPHSAEEEAQYVELALRLLGSGRCADTHSGRQEPVHLRQRAGRGVAPADRARGRTGRAAAAVARPNASKADAAREPELVEAFFAASSGERKLILTNLAVVGEPVPRRASPATSEVIRRLEAAAMQRNPGEFSRILERALSIGRPIAERITRDASGEPLVVAAKALGMPAVVLQRVLLVLNPAIGQSAARVFELSSLYEEIQPTAAERMVAIWREASAARKPAQGSGACAGALGRRPARRPRRGNAVAAHGRAPPRRADVMVQGRRPLDHEPVQKIAS